MYWTLIASTYEELAPFIQSRKAKEVSKNELYVYATAEGERVDIIISGCGLLPMVYRYTRYLSSFARPDVVIQAGIAGAYDTSVSIGDVFEVSTERIGDCGAEEKDGSHLDMFDLGLWDVQQAPFDEEGRLCNPLLRFPDLPKADALTLQRASGSQATIDRLKTKYPAMLESMEGAGFFYTSLLQKVPFAQVRAVSNFVEPRNKAVWDIPKAIGNLNDFIGYIFP